DLNKTRFVFAIGNHEYYNHDAYGVPWTGGYMFKDVFGDQAYYGAADSEITAGNYHAVVNGYDLIAINCGKYNGGVSYSDSDIVWLKKQLDSAIAARPGKPIFVISHPNIEGTNLGGDEGAYWASDDLYSVFQSYPQVIYFCGHMHFPENDERSIWQGDFTTIGIGAVYYSSNHIYDDENGNTFIDIDYGFETIDAQGASQGMYVEVDANNNVRVSRMDFIHNKDIKSPWIIPAPKADKSHLLYYTPAQERASFAGTAPVFPKGASAKEIMKAPRVNQKYEFQFTQAADNDMVYSYQVSFMDKSTDTVISTISTLSDFYLHANPSEMDTILTKTVYQSNTVLAPFSLSYSKPYYLKVVAVDCFGQKSAPIYSPAIGDIAIEDDVNVTPGKYSLDQNYPNPFNPSTIISYEIPAEKFVTLKVYDALGKEVKMLVSGTQNAGKHKISLDASGLSSGVYFYQLKAGDYSCVKKFVKLK
ncbi:MAG TPA: T9SS type A sorting domain-containing protein, partial [Ignavibacteriales bacterium]|nr:T9SS type A sorting domain-containing protein [Ignavibacteriales bacterium]